MRQHFRFETVFALCFIAVMAFLAIRDHQREEICKKNGGDRMEFEGCVKITVIYAKEPA